NNNAVVIYLPPYAFVTMPIEPVWGIGKGDAAIEYFVGRKPDDAIDSIRNSLYKKHRLGMDKSKGGAFQPNDLAIKLITRSLREADGILKERIPAFFAKRGEMGTWVAGEGDKEEKDMVNG